MDWTLHFNTDLIYIYHGYIVLFPPYIHFFVPTPPFSAEGTRGDTADNLDRVETIAKCLQQVGPKGVWLRLP